MTFFFDNQLGHEIVRILQDIDVDARHLRDVFDDEGVDDEVWIPIIAERGWVLITGDHRIARRREEKRVLHESRLIVFFLAKAHNNKTKRVRVRWILNQWDRIEAAAADAQPGDCFEVPEKGKLKKLGLWQED